ncbi:MULTISPECIES: DUF2339 domain-containing protein [unclassified Vibrio]|uniref:DUF2339 domain-containing protein n=1 Tax=unclassified Vibrio TaxID=2614977 RepID=UPI0014839D59|nr:MULTISPECIES: DUF2339 domain-containing protein [unclassified Vibrio]NNN44293.1 DUF2339 domain-containing protein [Vibrio sp. 1-1(7)]NNN72809.1 DUF2339 domain-containing protein [Vibrio sp. 12-2(3-a)]
MVITLIALAALLYGFYATRRLSKLELRLSLLERQLRLLHSQLFNPTERTQASPDPAESVADAQPSMPSARVDNAPSPSDCSNYEQETVIEKQPALSETRSTERVSVSSLVTHEKSWLEKQAGRFVANFREHWLVWIGALAMLVGSGYLVQVIGSQIEFSPLMRVLLAAALSLTVIFAGEWFHRREQTVQTRAMRWKEFTYVPAAVTATGLMGVYCTVIFAFILYQMLSPGLSLLILAVAALTSLALSMRQGPLMAVLGLIGGYSAPLWINSSEPNYFLLAGYIAFISIAATLLMQFMRKAWLAPSIALPHMVWMVMMIAWIPQQLLFSWLILYLSLTLYLIFLVPRMGWLLHPRYRHCQRRWSHSPVFISVAMTLMVLQSVTKIDQLTLLHIFYFYGLLMAVICLPALRKTWSLRVFLPTIIAGAVAVFALTLVCDALYPLQWQSVIWSVFALCIVLIGLRLFSQARHDSSAFTTRTLLILVPLISLISLVYLDVFIPDYAWSWTVFSLCIAGGYYLLARRFHSLSEHCSGIVHGMVVGCLWVWLNDIELTMAIAVQILVMTMQIQHRIFSPASWIVKVAMSVLVLRLTLLPFVPAWQPAANANWLWGVVSYFPALFILIYARTRLKIINTELSNWFEGACLHLLLMALFTQTHYALTGQYGYWGAIDFTSAIIFANQALVMGLIYSYRSQFAQKLTPIYQGYSYLLWGVFAGLMLLLNTFESPLWVNHVSAQALPIVNILTLGWLLPASILAVVVAKRWPTLAIQRQWLAITSAILAALWLGMSIRQFWQSTSMTLWQPTGMAELFSYSMAGLLVGGVLTWYAATRHVPILQRVGVAILAGVALKVFLWDVSSLNGFWRAVSFLGLGASLIALGWLFQKLNRSLISTTEAQSLKP